MVAILKLMKHRSLLILAAAALMAAMLAPQYGFAQDGAGDAGDAAGDVVDIYGVDEIAASTKLGKQTLQKTVSSIINVALSLLGIIAVVIILIGGFRWMTAGGNDDKVAEARKWIFSGIIGLAIVLSAWAIATFVIDKLAEATTGTGLDESLLDDV